jgi:hypothetical protein
MPTVRVSIDPERDGVVAPASNLFRWEDANLRPSSPSDTWLHLRQYPGKNYWIGLRQQELLAYIADHQIDYVVLTGDDGLFSSVHYASYLSRHPAFTLLDETAASTVEHAFVYAVNRTELAPIDHSTAISPHDAAALERETGMSLDAIATALGTPMRVTDAERGLSSREADAARSGVDLGLP